MPVLKEVIGKEDLLTEFAEQVKAVGSQFFPEAVFEDICDPAGAQRSDKNIHTSIEILNSLGIYPYYDRSLIKDGLELIRMKLSARVEALPSLVVDRSCIKLIEAFEGGYRYSPSGGAVPLQEHPYEDVMDCLRYAVMYKCGTLSKNLKKPKSFQLQNRYTGY